MKNKSQIAAEQRAAKASAPAADKPVADKPVAAASAAKPAAATTPLPTPNKQTATIERLTLALREKRQIEVKPDMLKQDGKFINLVIGKAWPTIRVGNSGGITVLELRSYASAFDAAVDGDTLLAKQNERDRKKAAAPVPTPAPAAKASAQQSA